MKDSTAVIVNLTEQTWTLHRGYGTFTVHGITQDTAQDPGRRASASGDRSVDAPKHGESTHGEKLRADKDDTVPNDPPSHRDDAHRLSGAAHHDAHHDARQGSAVRTAPYTLTRVCGRNAQMDLGDKRSIEVPISAMEVAQDLCREINSDGGEDSFFGVFAAAGDEPTGEELAAARARLETFYRRLVVAADREWERSHSYLFINDVERRAAQYLGLEKEWFYQVRETAECPACGEKVKPGVAVCKTCGAILDREKAASLGLGLTQFAAATAATAPSDSASPTLAASQLASPPKSPQTASPRR